MFDSDTKAPSDHGSPPSTPDGSSSNSKAAAGVSASSTKIETAKAAAAEIAISQSAAAKPDPVGDAIKKCKEVAKGESVFKASVAHIFDGLDVAYPTFLLVKGDKAEHQRVIDELMVTGNRERMPSLNKAPYNATVLACHPTDPEEWTLCSDWANVLTLADIEKVPAERFRTWVQDKKIGESKRKVRAFKQAAKKASKPLKTPFTEGEFPALAYVFDHLDDERTRQAIKEALIEVDQQVAKTLAAMHIIAA